MEWVKNNFFSNSKVCFLGIIINQTMVQIFINRTVDFLNIPSKENNLAEPMHPSEIGRKQD